MAEKCGWQLCGDGPEAYETYIVPAFSGAWAQDIVERAALHSGDTVLDLACGTGIVSRHAFKSMGKTLHIAGLDVNQTVIEKARTICPPDAMPIAWRTGHAASLPFNDAEFDVVLCQQGLQYFPDQAAALRETIRVLKSAGRVVFSVWRSLKYFPFYAAVCKALEAYVSEEAASMLSAAFAAGDPERLRSMFESSGFRNVAIRLVVKQMQCACLDDFLVGGFAASPYAGEILALNHSERDSMLQMIKQSVSDYMDDHGLAAPMEAYVISAVKS